MKEQYRLRVFDQILSAYQFDKPLSRFLSEFYRANKQMGSKDRKIAGSMVYNYFRLGKALPLLTTHTRLAIACFLCEKEPSAFFESLITEFTPLKAAGINFSIDEKLKIVQLHFPGFSIDDAFPFIHAVSDSIDKEMFLKSTFVQPGLWIRTKQKYFDSVKKELEANGIEYSTDVAVPNCIGLASNTSLEKSDSFAKGYFEVQDRSSQLTGNYLNAEEGQKWWDCCAASGGKSLMLFDKQSKINLTVSDTRESILTNLHQRFKKAGIRDFAYYQIDLVSGFSFPEPKPLFDGIILDAPCSGSGTWGRTPEMLISFKGEDIKLYQHRQMQIAENVMPYLKKGGALIYITCSVFRDENEKVTEQLVNKHGLTLSRSETIKGYGLGADSMFVARLIKN